MMGSVRRLCWFCILLVTAYVVSWAACMRWATVPMVGSGSELGYQWLGINEYSDYGVYEYRFRFADPELYVLYTPLRWVAHYGWRAWHQRDADAIGQAAGPPYLVVDFIRRPPPPLPRSERDWERVAATLRAISHWQQLARPHPALRRVVEQGNDIQRRYTLALQVYRWQQSTAASQSASYRDLLAHSVVVNGLSIAIQEWGFIRRLMTYHQAADAGPGMQMMLLADMRERIDALCDLAASLIALIERSDNEDAAALVSMLHFIVADDEARQWLIDYGLSEHNEAMGRLQQRINDFYSRNHVAP